MGTLHGMYANIFLISFSFFWISITCSHTFMSIRVVLNSFLPYLCVSSYSTSKYIVSSACPENFAQNLNPSTSSHCDTFPISVL